MQKAQLLLVGIEFTGTGEQAYVKKQFQSCLLKDLNGIISQKLEKFPADSTHWKRLQKAYQIFFVKIPPAPHNQAVAQDLLSFAETISLDQKAEERGTNEKHDDIKSGNRYMNRLIQELLHPKWTDTLAAFGRLPNIQYIPVFDQWLFHTQSALQESAGIRQEQEADLQAQSGPLQSGQEKKQKNNEQLLRRVKKRKQERGPNLKTIDEGFAKTGVPLAPITVCPGCKNPGLQIRTPQTRRSDEGPSEIYECKHKKHIEEVHGPKSWSIK
jgi:DNA-directed RNA polymerase subunit M/transcription elongation factor TFIIS